jgi:hypothetical protein
VSFLAKVAFFVIFSSTTFDGIVIQQRKTHLPPDCPLWHIELFPPKGANQTNFKQRELTL